MLHTNLDLDFALEPGRALLLLEVENLLEIAHPESSPLRRDKKYTHTCMKIIWDTRKLEALSPTEKVIFIAQKTARFDSHTYAAELLNAGHIVIAQKDCLEEKTSAEATSWAHDILEHPMLISVSSSERAKNMLLESASGLDAKQWTTIAVTGTNGKTSTTQITASMLEELSQKSVLRLGTLGIQIAGNDLNNPFPTQPDYPGLLAAARMAQNEFDCSQIVMEATSIGINEGRLGNWHVQCAAFLNLTQDHLDYHGDMRRYLDAKLDLFRRHLSGAGQVVVNVDDSTWESVVAAAASKSRLCVGFGQITRRDQFFEKAGSLFSSLRFLEVSQQRSNVDGIAGQWTLWLDKIASVSQCHYTSRLLGSVQHENLTAAAAMLLSLGYPLLQIAGTCHNLSTIAGRLERVTAIGAEHQPAVLVDYAHSPDALEKTLQTCRKLLNQGGQLICVFGCGGDRDPTKRPIMGRLATQLADRVWITSDNPRTEDPHAVMEDIVTGIDEQLKMKVVKQVDRKEAIREAIGHARANDIVLIAGKGHEDYQIIGNTKYPFSDSQTARQILNSKSKIQNTPEGPE